MTLEQLVAQIKKVRVNAVLGDCEGLGPLPELRFLRALVQLEASRLDMALALVHRRRGD